MSWTSAAQSATGKNVPPRFSIPRKPLPQGSRVLHQTYELINKDPSCSRPRVPDFDKAEATRLFCLGGLLTSICAAITCFGLSSYSFRSGRVYQTDQGGFTVDDRGQHIFFLGKIGQEWVKLAVNIGIALCTDSLGYTHSTCLRWALHREGRLEFNSSLRLLASTRRCSANRWSTNVVSAFLLMICYASSDLLFLVQNKAEQQNFVLNGIAIGTLGVGLLGQSLVAAVSLATSYNLIPSWSSDPLNTALICRQRGLQHRPGRCMLSVHEIEAPSQPSKPRVRQEPLRTARSYVRHVENFVWILLGASVIWAIVVLVLSKPWSHRGKPGVAVYGTGVPQSELITSAILIITFFQSWLTMALHCTELLVNAARDEASWRQAATINGARYSRGSLGSIKAACTDWRVIIIFVLKALMHWLLGLSLNVKGGVLFMNWRGTLALAGSMLVLAGFARFQAYEQPKGPQPATFGHLQTLVDLIDEWHEGTTIIFWGDKSNTTPGKNDALGGSEAALPLGVLHAGTSDARLRPVYMHQLYAAEVIVLHPVGFTNRKQADQS